MTKRCKNCAHFRQGGWGVSDAWYPSVCEWRPAWPEWLIDRVIASAETIVNPNDGWSCQTFEFVGEER